MYPFPVPVQRDNSAPTIPAEEVERILKYLDLPPSTTLPTPPAVFLAAHIYSLPPPLLLPFHIVPPRQRTSIPAIKSRRIAYSKQIPLPTPLTAESARLRWPLLWERLGGSHLPPPTAEVEEEEAWVKDGFLPGEGNVQHVKRLGGFLRGLQEEREMEEVRDAKRAERRLDEQAEEFDSDSDDEAEQESIRERQVAMRGGEDQRVVRRVFEQKVMELFIDGLDTIDYDPIDFGESPTGDVLAVRDDTERYFDAESPIPAIQTNGTDTGTANGNGDSGSGPASISHDRRSGRPERTSGPDDMHLQNGSGEYDY